MSFASSSAVTVRAIKESVAGVTPTTGNPVELRITGETLKYNITKESSAEINKNRTVSSNIPVTASASGGISSEIFHQGYDEMMASALQGAWAAFGTNGVGATTEVDATTTTLTAAVAPTGSSAFTALQLGQWFRIESDGPNDGKIVRVSTTTAPTSTVLTVDTNTPLVASTDENIQIQSSRLTHGTVQTSWTLERENSDIGVFIKYTGQTPSKMTMNISSGARSTMGFEFMGYSALEDDATMLPGTPIAAPAYEIHSGVAGASNAVWMDGAPVAGTRVKSVSLDFDNALRSQEAIGSLGAVGIGSGTINCTMTIQVYFANKDMFTKFRQNDNTSFVFATTDALGNGYIVSIPKANITDFTSNASGKDNDQMLDLQVTALEDRGNPVVALRKVIFIDRIGDALA